LKTAGVVFTLFVASAAGAEPKRVTLMTSGDEAQARAFTDSLRELLARLDVTLDVGPSDGGESAALAAVAADFSIPQECALTVVDDRGRVVMTRRLDQVGSPALLAEAAAHVVQSVIDDLRRPLEAHPPPPEEKLRAPAVPPMVQAPQQAEPKPESRFGLELSAFAAARLIGDFSGGGGISGTFNVKVGPVRPGITLAALYQAPVTKTEPFVTVSIQTLSPRALLSLEALRTPRFRFDVGLGGGADIFFIGTAGLMGGPMHPMHTPFYVSPVLSAMVRLQTMVSASTSVFVGLGADLDLQPPNFVEREGMSFESVLAAWRVRPSLSLGFSFGALP
jgi:hypothetical protein